jgi:hypothetical protein
MPTPREKLKHPRRGFRGNGFAQKMAPNLNESVRSKKKPVTISDRDAGLKFANRVLLRDFACLASEP